MPGRPTCDLLPPLILLGTIPRLYTPTQREPDHSLSWSHPLIKYGPGPPVNTNRSPARWASASPSRATHVAKSWWRLPPPSCRARPPDRCRKDETGGPAPDGRLVGALDPLDSVCAWKYGLAATLLPPRARGGARPVGPDGHAINTTTHAPAGAPPPILYSCTLPTPR